MKGKLGLVCWVAVLLFVFHPSPGFAFPDMVRHGYINCNTCHVSPSGGGALNGYGREMSREILSMWKGAEDGKEQYFAYGLLHPENTPVWLKAIQGEVRAVQFHREDKTVREGAFIPMQTDLEVVLTHGPLDFSFTYGGHRVKQDTHWKVQGFYGMFHFNESVRLRAGKFSITPGIKLPEHTAWIRRDLGFGENTDSPVAEISWFSEKAGLTTDLRMTDSNPEAPQPEKGILSSFYVSPIEKTRIQASFYQGDDPKKTRNVYSLSTLSGLGGLGLSEALTFMGEASFINSRGKVQGDSLIRSRVEYLRLNYEWVQGLTLYGLRERSQSNVTDLKTEKEAWGAGAQWFPRTHFEIQMQVEKVKIKTLGDDFGTVAWLLFHYYL